MIALGISDLRGPSPNTLSADVNKLDTFSSLILDSLYLVTFSLADNPDPSHYSFSIFLAPPK